MTSQLNTFSVWIYRKYLAFSQKKPCNLPSDGCLHLSVVVSADQCHLDTIKAVFYRNTTNLTVECGRDQLDLLEDSLVGDGSLLTKITKAIEEIPVNRRLELIRKSALPCFGNATKTLTYLLITQLAVVVFLIKSKVSRSLPIPTLPDWRLSRQSLQTMVIYWLYNSVVSSDEYLKGWLEIVTPLLTTWSGLFVSEINQPVELFHAKLNLAFLRHHHQVPDSSWYQILESKQADFDKTVELANRNLAAHFSTLSEEVINYAVVEVRQRLQGCLEELIHQSEPVTREFINNLLQEQVNLTTTCQQQLDTEMARVRETCQQAFLALESIPAYEERIKYLENQVKQLQKSYDDDLHRKVEHLQSTVTKLLQMIRCR